MITDEIYNANYANRYESTIVHPYTQYKLGVLANRITESYDNPVVLDMGCNINPFHPSGLRHRLGELATYTGVDIAPDYFTAGDGNARVVVGSGDNLPFKDAVFDTLVAADVLEHIPNLDETAAEIGRVLKPGGRAIVVIPQFYKLDAFQLPEMRTWRQTSHVHFFTASQWSSNIERAGGLELLEDESRALGILSGLLYITWLSPDFITHHDYTPRHAELFARAKREASLLDPLMDDTYRAAIANNGQLMATLAERDLLGSLTTALDLAEEFGGPERTKALRAVAEAFDATAGEQSSVRSLLAKVAMSKEFSSMTANSYSIANSTLLVFRKPHFEKVE